MAQNRHKLNVLWSWSWKSEQILCTRIGGGGWTKWELG